MAVSWGIMKAISIGDSQKLILRGCELEGADQNGPDRTVLATTWRVWTMPVRSTGTDEERLSRI